MDHGIFVQLTFVIAIAAGISLIMRVLRQPLIMGYILTGIIVGPAALHLVSEGAAFTSFSQIGITLLLFIIGLGLNPAVIRSLGKPVILTALSILLLVGSIGFAVGYVLHFSNTEALITGLALFFSSTIIILKVISDKKELSRLYAQLSVGVIVVDDIVATLSLLVVATIGTAGSLMLGDFALLAAKGLAVALFLVLSTVIIMPRLSKLFADSQELLFLFAIAWAFSIANIFSWIGFSYEIGALAAGVSLAPLPYAIQMSTRLKPLRDFFIVLFFVHLGETFAFGQLANSIIPALILSFIVILGKPLAVMATLGALGYTRLTSFKAGIHLSQISEFSMILVVFAHSQGMVGDHALAVITLVAIISIGASTYLMKYDDAIFNRINHWLHIFEHRQPNETAQTQQPYQTVLFGYTKGGHEFVQLFRKLRQHYLVVDYNPLVIDYLEDQGIRHAYGDATDIEFLEEMGIQRASLIVSTIDEHAVNVSLLRYLHHQSSDATFICHASDFDQAKKLYDLGALYVILPHYIGSERLSSFIKANGIDRQALEQYRQKHLKTMAHTPTESLIEASIVDSYK